MRKIFVSRVVVNIGAGEAGERLIKAQKVLEMLTGRKPVQTISKTQNKDLGLRKGMPIGCKVTLRGQEAVDFLKRAFWVKENRIAGYSFDAEGNFSLGIADYTVFENMKYDPDIGIFGMDISATLRRPGERVAKRRRVSRKIPRRHRIDRAEGIEFVKKLFELEVIE